MSDVALVSDVFDLDWLCCLVYGFKLFDRKPSESQGSQVLSQVHWCYGWNTVKSASGLWSKG